MFAKAESWSAMRLVVCRQDGRAGLSDDAGNPKVRIKYHQEIAPDATSNRAEVIGFDCKLKTPATKRR